MQPDSSTALGSVVIVMPRLRKSCLRPLAAALFAAYGHPGYGAPTYPGTASVLALAAAGNDTARGTSASRGGPRSEAALLAVENCADAGRGSLRSAIAAATNNTVISMTALDCSKISLTTGALIIDHAVSNLFINGPTSHTLTIDANYLGRAIVHNGEGTLTLDHLTITHGSYTSGYDGGACIYALGSVTLQHSTVANCTTALPAAGVIGGGMLIRGNLVMTDSILRGNQVVTSNSSGASAGGGAGVLGNIVLTRSSVDHNLALAPQNENSLSVGGGLWMYGSLQLYASTIAYNSAQTGGGAYLPFQAATINNSTISNNEASARVGGLATFGVLSLRNSTIAFNRQAATGLGAGILAGGPTLVVDGTIIASNTSTANGADLGLYRVMGSSITGSHNLITASNNSLPPDTITGDPKLAPLHDNGGPTSTHALKIGSPALNAGNNPLAFSFDQRGTGHARAIGAGADIGAFELNTLDAIFFDGFD